MSATGDDLYPNGFTLIEALVVVAILALISGLAFPRVQQMIDAARFSSARTMLLGAVAEARARAIRTDSATRLTASPDGADLIIGETVIAQLPSGIRIAPQSRMPAFFSDGSASGGLVTLNGTPRQATLTIVRETGLSRWRP